VDLKRDEILSSPLSGSFASNRHERVEYLQRHGKQISGIIILQGDVNDSRCSAAVLKFV
jgi:hypothetical protein